MSILLLSVPVLSSVISASMFRWLDVRPRNRIVLMSDFSLTTEKGMVSGLIMPRCRTLVSTLWRNNAVGSDASDGGLTAKVF